MSKIHASELCEKCRYSKWDYCEYYGGGRQWFIEGCKKGLEPYYNEEEESTECEGYKERDDG